jgi:hypothetical protein
MNKKELNLDLIAGVGAGALLIYIFDPQTGRRLRTATRDKALRLAHKTADAIDVTSRDLKNRALGVMAEARGFLSEGAVSDEVIEERVRSKLGFLASHPSSIKVKAENGKVILSGPMLQDEVDRLLRRVASIRGVGSVENRLEAHASPESVPGLRGRPEPRRPGPAPDIMQASWVAALFRADPKSEMNEDLMRMKSLIETGMPPHDAARKDERIAYTH